MKTLKEMVLDGEIGIRNDGTIEQTKEVLDYVFPKSEYDIHNIECTLFDGVDSPSQVIIDAYSKNNWIQMYPDEPQLPDYPIADFLNEIKQLNNKEK